MSHTKKLIHRKRIYEEFIITKHPCPLAYIENLPQLPSYQAEMFHHPIWIFLNFHF